MNETVLILGMAFMATVGGIWALGKLVLGQQRLVDSVVSENRTLTYALVASRSVEAAQVLGAVEEGDGDTLAPDEHVYRPL
jgi:hypothetical protein